MRSTVTADGTKISKSSDIMISDAFTAYIPISLIVSIHIYCWVVLELRINVTNLIIDRVSFIDRYEYESDSNHKQQV